MFSEKEKNIYLIEENAIEGFQSRTLNFFDVLKIKNKFSLFNVNSMDDFSKICSKKNISTIAEYKREDIQIFEFLDNTFEVTENKESDFGYKLTFPNSGSVSYEGLSGHPFEKFTLSCVKKMLSDNSVGKYTATTFINGSYVYEKEQKDGVLRLNICFFEFNVEWINRDGLLGWVLPKRKKVTVSSKVVYVYVTPLFLELNYMY